MSSLIRSFFVAAVVLGVVACGGGGGGGGGDGRTGGGGLTSGQAVTGSIRELEWKHYTINVPADSGALTVQVVASSGDTDLLVKFNEQPNEDMYYADGEDCYDYAVPGGDAICYLPSPAAGVWYISLWGTDPTTNYSLTATILPASSPTASSVRTMDESDDARRLVAQRYIKHDRKPATELAESPRVAAAEYPQSGSLEMTKNGDGYRFYFGTDAVTPAVLSVEHDGIWSHFDSWQQFESAVSR